MAADHDERTQAECSPLCAAARVYRHPQWWQHEALCPVRREFLERRDRDRAKDASHAEAVRRPEHSGRSEDASDGR